MNVRRIARGLVSGTIKPTTILVWQAGPLDDPPALPVGFSAVRVRGADPGAVDLARAAMRAVADDGEEHVRERFALGHELFGWQGNGESIACFGWVCFRQRTVGLERLRDSPGRAFIYNCHTLPAFRGRGLYTALLRYIRSTLAGERFNHFIIDVNRRNLVSRRGIERAGFQPVASLTSLRVLGRWNCLVNRRVYDQAGSSIFGV
jgi:hypothetical protein